MSIENAVLLAAQPSNTQTNSVKPTESVKGSLRGVCFGCALVLVFLRFSFLHETFAAMTGVNAYVLYVFGPLALLGVVVTGGVQRTLRQAPGIFWLGFVAWMILAVPFSSWRGGSFTHVVTYVRTDFIMLFVTAGLSRTWADCKKLMYAIAAAAIVNLGTAHLFVNAADTDRLTLQGNGVISNPNDLAAHLLLVLPFLLFIVLKQGTHTIFRTFFVAAIAIGMFQILRTGSRGALVALVLTTIFIVVRGSARQKITVGFAASVLLVILIGLLPSTTWNRLTSFSESKEATDEAVASREARQYLLKMSIIYTLQKPLFGVGPGQFSSYEGQSRVDEGLKGYWHETHNSYTQISSECGVPALAFYVAATVATFGLLGKIREKARGAHRKEIITATFCITIGLVAYSLATLFVNFGYRYYLPTISGLVVAIWLAVRRDRQPARGISEQAATYSLDPVAVLHPDSP